MTKFSLFNGLPVLYFYQMPPKKKKNDSNGESPIETMTASSNETASFGSEMLLDNCLKKQTDHLNDLFYPPKSTWMKLMLEIHGVPVTEDENTNARLNSLS